MKFLTLTRIAALLATSGLASASIDVCAGSVKLDCDTKASTILGNLDSLPPLDAFRSVRTFFQGHCDGACLSPKLKADLCEKAHIIKPLIKEKIFLEDIRQCFPDIAVGEKSCHVSYECPPGTPEGITCITNSCASPNAETTQERIMLLLKMMDLIDEEPQTRFAIVDFLLDWLLKETGYD